MISSREDITLHVCAEKKIVEGNCIFSDLDLH